MNFDNRLYRLVSLLLLVVLFVLVRIQQWAYTPDDTFIYLRYAENLSSTGVFAFNPGTPSYGTTGPVWAGFASLLTFLPLEPLLSVKLLDLLFAFGAIFLTHRLALDAGVSTQSAFLAVTVFVFDAWFLRWSATGMETSAFTTAMLASVVLAHRQPLLSGLMCGFAALLRPEGILLLPVLLWARRKRIANVLAVVGSFIAPVASWLVYAWVTFGTLLPNTYAGKTGEEMTASGMVGTLWDIVSTFSATQGVLLLISSLGALILIVRKNLAPLKRIFAFSWVLLLVAGYTIKEVDVVSRYLVPAIPFLIVCGFVLLEEMLNLVRSSQRLKMAGILATALVTIVQNIWVYQSRVVPHMETFSAGMRNCLMPIAFYINQATEPDATVLVPDVGLMGYVGKRTMLDVAGLITPGVRTLFLNRTYDEGMVEGVWKPLKPGYVLDRSVTPERLASGSLIPLMTRRFGPLALRSSDEVYYTLYRYTPSH